ELQPTILVMPSAADLHPDHNALHVLLHLALARLDMPLAGLTRVTYLVHTKGRRSERNRIALKLHHDEKTRKRAAILCHASQMALSRRRFLAYARELETFYVESETQHFDPHHPVTAAAIED